MSIYDYKVKNRDGSLMSMNDFKDKVLINPDSSPIFITPSHKQSKGIKLTILS